MAGVSGDFAAIKTLAVQLEKLGSDEARQLVSMNMAEAAKYQIDTQFHESISPYGDAWAPLKCRTGKPLWDTANLKGSLAPLASPGGFAIRTSFVGAAVHQYGAVIKAKPGKRLVFSVRGKPTERWKRGKLIGPVFAQQVKIPRRQYMPEGEAGPSWERGLREAAEDMVADLMEHG